MGLAIDAAQPFDGILIFSSLNEPCTAWVTKELETAGAEYLLVNFEEAVLDRLWSVALEPSKSSTLTSIRGTDAEHLGIEAQFAPRSVWMRRWGFPVYPAAFDETSAAFAFGEISSIVHALPDLLDATWVNPQANERRASNKILQLRLANSLGFKIPRTLVSNDAAEIRRFRSEVGRTIFKPVSAFQPQLRKFNAAAQAKHAGGLGGVELGFGPRREPLLVFTQELTEDKLQSLESIRWAPAIFQERIDKKADIRVTVVGSQVFSCRIHSQERTDTETDFRMMNLTGVLRHEPLALSDPLNAMVLNLMNELGLTFGCFDLIETHEGDFYFLEVNPAGQWLWIEQLTGAPISKALATQLMARPA